MPVESLKARIERCRARVEKKPDSAVAHYNLGLAYTQRGYVDRAEAEYLRAVELDPTLGEAWINLGGARLLKWDFEGALEAVKRGVELRDDLPIAHYNLGQAYLYMGDAEGVVAANRRVIELDPDNGAAHYFLAVGLLALERREEARQALSRAMALGHRPSPEFLKKLNRPPAGEPATLTLNEHSGAGEAPGTEKEV